MADLLADEQTFLVKHMTSVGEHIEHIKEIVAMQQSYAKVSGVYETLSVAELVEDALRMNSAAFDRHRIELIREFDENMPSVSVDRHKVLQILINLLRNAKHAMDGRNGEDKRMVIRVALTSSGRVRISVADNGMGITKDDLPRIFERFYRADKARSRELGGTGLGLAIVKHIAQLHGGRVEAESELGHGTTIRVVLPVGNRE